MSASLKQKAIFSMIWSSIGKFGTLGLSFISNLVLARILMPSDFGYIGMLHIFIAISQVFINSGLGSALIQKKDVSHIDYSTVFYWNLFLSLFFYSLLYLTAPSIAGFYEMDLLKDILRVQSIILLINSFSLVQTIQLQKNLHFKALSIRNIIAALIGTVVAIVMALMGYGVWSLVFSNLIAALAGVVLLWRMSSWRPTLEFSFSSLKSLFSFGGLILLSSLVETAYTNIQGLIIGKVFSANDLGYYTQARKLEDVPTKALSSIVNQVSFPVFSQLQDNLNSLRAGVQRNITSISFLNFPLMVLFIVIARPLIILLYTQRWEESIPYFQILCVGAMLYTINTVNTNVIRSLGKGALYFWVQLIKRLAGIISIVISVQYGIETMLWTIVILNYVFFIINGIVTGKIINYGFIAQLKDIYGVFILSITVGVVTYYGVSLFHIDNYLLTLIIHTLIYSLLYISLSYVFKIEGFFTYKEVVKNLLLNKRKRN